VPRRRHFVIDSIPTDHVYEVISASKARCFGPVMLAGQGSVNRHREDMRAALATQGRCSPHQAAAPDANVSRVTRLRLAQALCVADAIP
jgi:hypothetical protein